MYWIVFFLFCVLLNKEAASQQVTLDSAIVIAMRNSPSLAIFKNVVDIAGINNNYGIAGGLPVVQSVNTVAEQLTSLQQTYSNPLNNKSSMNASSNQLNAGVAATVPVYAGGRIVNEKNRLGVVVFQTQQQFISP